MSAQSFTPGAAMFVAHQSVVKTTNSGEPAVPTATLAEYNVSTSQQLQGISDRIRNNTSFGLPFFGRSIDPNVLRDIATDTVLQDLADIVFFESFEVSQRAAASARGRAGARAGAQAGEGAVERAGERAGEVAPRGPLGPVAAYAQENPLPALLMAAAAGMLVGFLLGGTARR